MALLNIFKGKKGKFQKRQDKREERTAEKPVVLPKKEVKKPKERAPESKKEAVKKGNKKADLKTPSSAQTTASQSSIKRKGEVKIAPQVLQFPRITEKATFLMDQDQYIFRVFSTATKPEIKKSIEEVYGVDVLQVRVINVKGKSKRLGRSRGFQSGYKKAIVKLKKGQTIEVMPR